MNLIKIDMEKTESDKWKILMRRRECLKYRLLYE